MLVNQSLGVKLDPQQKRRAGSVLLAQLNRLNDAISCPSRGAEHWGQLANGLMVRAVDAKCGSAKNTAHQRVRFNLDGMREFVGLAFDMVVHGLRSFCWDVGHEPTAQGDI